MESTKPGQASECQRERKFTHFIRDMTNDFKFWWRVVGRASKQMTVRSRPKYLVVAHRVEVESDKSDRGLAVGEFLGGCWSCTICVVSVCALWAGT